MATPTYDPFMHRLDMIRVKQGMSMATWAQMAGISRTQIYTAMEDREPRSYRVRYLLALALAVKLDIIVSHPLD